MLMHLRSLSALIFCGLWMYHVTYWGGQKGLVQHREPL